MRIVRNFVFAVASVASTVTVAHADELKYRVAGVGTESTYFIDTTTLDPIRSDLIEVWLLVFFHDRTRVDYAYQFERYDCTNRTHTNKHIALYKDGKHILGSKASDTNYIVPNSVNATILRQVCYGTPFFNDVELDRLVTMEEAENFASLVALMPSKR